MNDQLTGPMLGPGAGEAQRLVVLLHGYGSDGNDLIALGRYWQELLPDALFVAPNAPSPCDINPIGFQWFPLDLDRDISRLAGHEAARLPIENFLSELWAETGLSPSQTILGGFSQGAMMALDVGLRLPTPLMGLIGFSGGVIDPETMRSEIRSRPPVCLIHGAEDDIVPVRMSVVGGAMLKDEGLEVTMHVSPGTGHSIAPDGLDVAREFITGIKG